MEDRILGSTRLQQKLESLPRKRFALLPTPLHYAQRLSEVLGGPRIYIKRDELTGMPLAGNKTRMMEFVIPRILDSGADCVIGGAPIQSNYCRQLTGACTQVGLDVYLVMMPKPADLQVSPQGNLLLDLLMGARVQILETDSGSEVVEAMHRLANRLKAMGRNPFVARMANTDDIGLDAAAYVNCTLELHRQFEEKGINPDFIYLASADTTQAGLLLGAKALGASYRIVGFNPIDTLIFETPVVELVSHAALCAAGELQIDLKISPDEVISNSDYVGDGYAIPTEACLDAIRLVARLEGIILDPVYSGKAMAGLIDHVRRGVLASDHTVVFVHTGGYPAVFAYNDYFDFSAQITIGELD